MFRLLFLFANMAGLTLAAHAQTTETTVQLQPLVMCDDGACAIRMQQAVGESLRRSAPLLNGFVVAEGGTQEPTALTADKLIAGAAYGWHFGAAGEGIDLFVTEIVTPSGTGDVQAYVLSHRRNTNRNSLSYTVLAVSKEQLKTVLRIAPPARPVTVRFEAAGSEDLYVRYEARNAAMRFLNHTEHYIWHNENGALSLLSETEQDAFLSANTHTGQSSNN